MQPDLSPHLHTDEYEWVWKCTKQERIWRRDTNPSYGKRTYESKRLPIEYWTPTLHKLKSEGKINIDESNGCKI
ncbi:COX assembly mitochondrial protein 2 homolog [Strongyloides ratti]|uniref:COX assembly mitochondrial protein 2 homolog n=1 Tax=Strongyloides ratti TaxID=34506 RepID=A0A090L270_STRRB|nr:COX assembly mitochondrial protein 2 homolog [Strongyloides ratti]CEF63916.1 COX assembly mitochondrial protein 2 homolog [Strongyloides ratti]